MFRMLGKAEGFPVPNAAIIHFGRVMMKIGTEWRICLGGNPRDRAYRSIFFGHFVLECNLPQAIQGYATDGLSCHSG